jgi:hypothetical protein
VPGFPVQLFFGVPLVVVYVAVCKERNFHLGCRARFGQRVRSSSVTTGSRSPWRGRFIARVIG